MKIKKYLKKEKITYRILISALISVLICFLPMYFFSKYLFISSLTKIGIIQSMIFFIASIIHFYFSKKHKKISNVLFFSICLIILFNILRYALTLLIIFISQNIKWIWG